MTEIFKKLDFNEFKLRYKGDIRVNIAWDRLKWMRMGLITQPTEPMYIPWYENGNWRDGRPKLIKVGTKPAIVRLPALWLGGRVMGLTDGYLLLDGCHRINEIKPRFVVLDVLYPQIKQRPYFTDLFNKYYNQDNA